MKDALKPQNTLFVTRKCIYNKKRNRGTKSVFTQSGFKYDFKNNKNFNSSF